LSTSSTNRRSLALLSSTLVIGPSSDPVGRQAPRGDDLRARRE
jgi:hypothetical protein